MNLSIPCLAVIVAGMLSNATRAALVDLVPLQTGYTVATCYSGNNIGGGNYMLPPPDPNSPVVAVFNTSPVQLGLAPTNNASLSYNWQFCHNEVGVQSPAVGPQHVWTAANLGEVFGIALDDDPQQNIYVAATSAFGYANWPGTNGPGTIYKLSGATGAITAFPQLPGAGIATGGSGPGAALGNLCYHRSLNGLNRWLYVTNMGDGRIYRVNATTGIWAGVPGDTFDHGMQALPVASYPQVPDNPSLTYTQDTRRPWGIGVHAGRLYYSIFSSMDPAPPFFTPLASGPQPEVWSVALDSAGNFLPATSVREFKLPQLTSFFVSWPPTFAVPSPPVYPLNRSSLPVSDIEFTSSGAMILAERYHAGCIAPNLGYPGFLTGAHSTRALEYTGSTGAWVASPQNKYQVGFALNFLNSAGGVGPACDGAIWCSGDALAQPFGGNYAYGIERIRPGGNAADSPPILLAHMIDFDGLYNVIAKSLIGDVDTVIEPPRLSATVVSAACPAVPGGPYVVTLNVTNLMPSATLTQIIFGPCPPAFLPPGAQSLVPSPSPVNVNIAPGASSNVTVTMSATPIGGMYCFSIQGNPGGSTGDPFLCSPKVCVTLPKCPCMELLLKDPHCPVYEGDSHTATLTIKNLWPTTAYWYTLLPCPINELPAGAITVPPSPAGLQAFAPPLVQNATSPPITITLPGVPVSNTPITVCFSVQLSPQNEGEGAFCEGKVCITFPPCPPLLPCVTLAATNVQCPVAPPGNYTLNLTITNQGATPAATAILSPCPPPAGNPGVPATPQPGFITLPPLLQGQSQTYPIQLGGVSPGGVTGCFCVSLLDANQRPLCSKVICVPLPPCPCATFSLHDIQCPQYEGQTHIANVTITNTGFMPIWWVGFTPCPPMLLPPGALPGVVPGPPGLQPLPPLNPGNSITVPVTLTGVPKAGGLVCFTITLFGEMENVPLCDGKFCFTVPQCPPCLPCMNATATSAVCPNVTGGPFTTNVTITNLQPVPAATAWLLPCLPGLAAGEVAATPLPGVITLPPLLQNQSQSYPITLSGVTSGQLGCFCVQLRSANGSLLCEKAVCLTMSLCPALCATLTATEITCPMNGNGYSIFLQIFNQSASQFFFYQTFPVPVGNLPPGAITAQPQPAGLTPLTPSIPPGITGGAPIQLPNNLPPGGSTFCFIVKFFGQSDNLICQQMVCVNLPPCACATILSHSVDCVPAPGGGLKRQLTVTVQNNTNFFGPPFSFAAGTILPGTGFSPSVITPVPNPIPPGGTGTFTTCYLGNKPPNCINIFLTDAARTRCCPLKLCPLWVECAPDPHDDHDCRLASEFISENGAPAAVTAWIFNASGTPKYFNWSVGPAAVAGCTGNLPLLAFFPASGTAGPVGPWSTLAVPFTISGASLVAGQCAGFQFCFSEDGLKQSPVHCCVSKLKRSNLKDVCVIWDPLERSIPVGAGTIRLIIKNPTTTAQSLSLLLVQDGGYVDYSLTGMFSEGPDSGAAGPPVDAEVMPLDVNLGPGEVLPLTFKAKVKVIPFPPVDPIFDEWHLIRLCRGPITDPDTLATHLFHIPYRHPGSPTLPDQRNYRYVPHAINPSRLLALETDPGEVLTPLQSTDLQTFLPDWLVPYGSIQGADGTLTGTGGPLFAQPLYAPAARRGFSSIGVSKTQ